MKGTLVVLALAALSAAGCRAIGTNGGCGCGEPCCDGYGCGETCGESYGDPCCGQPDCGGQCGRGGCLEDGCQGGCQDGCCAGGGCFDRYCGHNCGPGYGPGPYDCSACCSPNWGCNGYRHPYGYVGGHECQCEHEHPERTQPIYAGVCGNGYCCCMCGKPAPACCCNSGDQNYNFNPGPPVAQTAYPYYTVRGPRDFLLDNPPPLGPY